MSDKLTTKNHGGRRAGAGRKKLPVSPTGNVRAAIDRVLKKDPKAMDEVWQAIINEAKKGSERHAALLLAYRFGKPTEVMEITTKQLILKRIIVDDGNG